MKRIALALAASLAATSLASAQTYTDAKGTIIPAITIASGPYQLASNVNAAVNTTPVSVLKNPNYIFACVASVWATPARSSRRWGRTARPTSRAACRRNSAVKVCLSTRGRR